MSAGTATAHSKIIGVGNRWRCDDAAGLVAARRLRELEIEDAEVVELEGEPTSLIDLWEGAQRVLVIDAVASGAAPGTVHQVDALAARLPDALARHSTHAFGLAEAIELGRALDRLPPQLTVFGIEGRRFEAGAELTPSVKQGVERAVTAVADLLGGEHSS